MAELRLDRVREESSDTSERSSSVMGNSVVVDCCRDSDSLYVKGHDIVVCPGGRTKPIRDYYTLSIGAFIHKGDFVEMRINHCILGLNCYQNI